MEQLTANYASGLVGSSLDTITSSAIEQANTINNVPDALQDAAFNYSLALHQTRLVQEIQNANLPDAIKESALSEVNTTFASHMIPNVSEDHMQAVDSLMGTELSASVDDFWDTVMENVARQLAELAADTEEEEAAAGAAAGGAAAGGAGGANWLVALARTLGKVQDHFAGLMVAAAEEMAAITESTPIFHAVGQDTTGQQINAAGQSEGQVQAAQNSSRADFFRAQGEFQAYSQMFRTVSEHTATALKSVGEGLSSVARKQ